MSTQNVRWILRFKNYIKALGQLKEAQQRAATTTLNNLEKQGLIQAFEFTHELAWNVLKDYIEHSGGQNLIGSKDTTREAFQKNLISNGEDWMAMIKSRNLTSHTYNEVTADQIVSEVLKVYLVRFLELEAKMKTLIK